MTLVFALSALGAALILGVAFLLPCEACRRRRERMRVAYARWRAEHSG